jgi:bacterioferritin
MPKPLMSHLPYPDIGALTADMHAASILYFAYATPRGELNATLQYVYHSYFAAKYSDLLLSIAIAEMKHLEIIGQALVKLGIDPQYRQTPSSNAEYFDAGLVDYSTSIRKMIAADIKGELNAIADYQKMTFLLRNDTVKTLVERIIVDEKMHLEALQGVFSSLRT